MTPPRTLKFIVVLILAVFTLNCGELYSQTWTISGVVVDAAGGPIVGVDLDLVDPASPATVIPITGDTSGIDGSFLISINATIPAGSYTLQLEPTTAHIADEISISLNGNLDVGTLALASGWLITGSVVDSQGNPVPTIDIDIRSDQAGWLDLIGDNTNSLGEFSVAIPAIIDEYRITFSDTSLTPSVFPIEQDLGLLFGSTNLGLVEMPRAHTVSGLVVDEDGIPLPGIDMNVYDATGTAIDLFNDDTNAQGLFSVLVPEGTWTIRHRVVTPIAGIERIDHEIADLPVLAGIDLGTVVLPLGYHIQGIVTGSAGELIQGADFDALYALTGESIYIASDTSNSNGSFDILLPEGDIVIEVDPPLTGPVRVPKKMTLSLAPISPINLGQIILEDGVTVSGSFSDNLGNPVPSVDVEFFLFNTGQAYETLHENGNQAGNFSAAVISNDYNLTFTPNPASGLGAYYIENLECYTPTNLGNIVLSPSATISGAVTSSGTPLAGIQILAADSITGVIPPWGSTITDLEGNYALSLTEGTWTFTAVAPQTLGISDLVEGDFPVTQGSVLDFNFPNFAAEITNLNCIYNTPEAVLTWVNGGTYDWISVDRNGLPLTTLAGDQTTFSDNLPGSGSIEYTLKGHLLGIDSIPVSCSVDISVPFIRCDSDLNSNITISDAINILSYLFSTFSTSCTDAMDCNDSGSINIADPVVLLNFLFSSGPNPPAPYPNPGQDPTADALTCD
ncbi:hypothetical protein CBD41_02530 [bacterium TMED181]|nr:hypothetical protein [Planctomycetota bacterium]OUW46474.1 MAG: hypothetical protein CBD41_02530 [bacterium TMED181]